MGPFHHKDLVLSTDGSLPLDKRSAGFSALETCLHLAALVYSCTSPTLFLTNVLRENGGVPSQDKTIEESVQRLTVKMSRLRPLVILSTNFANKSAAHNSKRGIEVGFNGATLVFEHNKEDEHSSWFIDTK